MKIASKFRFIVAIYGLIPLAIIVFSGVQYGTFELESYQFSFCLALASYFLLVMFCPHFGLKWLFLKQFKEIETFCYKIRKGNYEEHFNLPNQPADEGDENELVFLKRNLNWMIRLISVREKSLKERNIELMEKSGEIQSLLHNMRQGILTIGADNRILPEYSSHLENILESGEIANQSIEQVLFSNSDLSENELSQVLSSLEICLGEDEMNYEMNEHIFIKKYRKNFANKRRKNLELFWNPILNRKGVVEKIMLVVRDVTKLEILEKESKRQQKELTILGQIATVPPNKFLDFTSSSINVLEKNKDIIKKSRNPEQDALSHLFRNMHTVKGNARTYGFSFLANITHEVEQYYDDLRNNPISWDEKKMLHDLKRTLKAIEEYETIFKQKLNGQSAIVKDGKFVEKQFIEQLNQNIEKICRTLDNKRDIDLGKMQKFASQLKQLVGTMDSIPTRDIITTISNALPDLAKELNKPAPCFNLKYHPLRFTQEASSSISNALMHIFRNALDHGIESPEQRKFWNKPEKGEITLNILLNNEEIQIEFYDDGQGLNLQKIKNRAIEKKLIAPDLPISDQEVAELVFHSGLSTAHQVTEISGRGVGMDAVKKLITDINGAIEIQLNPEQTEGVCQPFKLRINLPAKYVLTVESKEIVEKKLIA